MISRSTDDSRSEQNNPKKEDLGSRPPCPDPASFVKFIPRIIHNSYIFQRLSNPVYFSRLTSDPNEFH
jgi:hypothetical protein